MPKHSSFQKKTKKYEVLYSNSETVGEPLALSAGYIAPNFLYGFGIVLNQKQIVEFSILPRLNKRSVLF